MPSAVGVAVPTTVGFAGVTGRSSAAATGATVRRVSAVSNDSPLGAILVVGVLLFGAYKCTEGGADRSAANMPSPAAESRLDDAAEDAVAGTTYRDQGAPYGCTQDCSGHEAGYQWAERREIHDPDECGGNSQSFIEGCRAYAEAYQAARENAREDDDDEELQ